MCLAAPIVQEDFFQGCLDDRFDAEFEAMELPWLPWVGSQYRASSCKTIVLGESIYVYGDGSEKVRNSILAKDSLRRGHMRHGVLAMFKSAYVRNLERAVLSLQVMFIRHPSSFFSWKEWGQALRQANILLDPADPSVCRPVQPVSQL
jgi:hypothetical protein